MAALVFHDMEKELQHSHNYDVPGTKYLCLVWLVGWFLNVLVNC